MSQGNRQPKWDISEAVILLDGYLEALQTNQSQSRIVKRVSTDLRQMAINRGVEFDEVYRNENGISYQIKSMDSAYKGKTIYVPATKLFKEVVELYRTNTERYHKILEEAKCMATAKQNKKDAFLAWASSVLPDQRCKWIEDNIQKVEQFANATKILSGSIFDITDPEMLETIYRVTGKNKLFQIKNRKLIKNISDDFRTYIQYCIQTQAQEKQESEKRLSKVDPQAEVVSVFSGDTELSQTTLTNSLPSSTAEASSRVITVLKQHYEYGFKLDSIRELMRFRQFAEAMGITLPEDDEALKASILSSGAVIDDKVYCKSYDLPQELWRIVDDAFSSGAGVIYYESLFEREQDWMESHIIISSEMLKEYLQKSVPGCSFSKKFMVKGSRRTEKEVVTDELKRVWGTRPSESVNNLSARLPYIPLSNIWRVISGNNFFVLVSEGEYLLVDRFNITRDEEEDILDFVEEACEENGFSSLSDVPLGDIEEENYELSQMALLNAIYKKVLSDRYHLNGKILTKEKSELDAVMLLKQYIKGKDECTFDEVANKVIDLTGCTNRQYAFQALYDDMVRVDKNRFVSNRLVNFSIDEIDAALSEFITDKFRAIRDVTTFAMFPLCGQSWNHYLLESFCYKYSRKYSLHVIHFNDKNAGIIAEKDCNMKYDEMLAITLARTDVELSTQVIGQYLFNTGYMAKSKYAKLNDIAQRAVVLRKER